MRIMIFNMLLIASCSYALLRGGSPERTVAAALVAAYLATLATFTGVPTGFQSVELGILLVDAALLFVLLVVALRADRGWVLILAGLQLDSVGAHLLKFLDVDMIRVTYAVMIAIWSYPMLIALVVGTHRHQRRLKAKGYDLAWTIRSDTERPSA